MDLRILGPLEVWEGTEQIRVDAPRQRALLALLAIHANEVVSTDRIIDELWGDEPPGSPLRTLRYHVSKLRSALGDGADHVVTRSPGYVLEVAPGAIDVHRFAEMAARGRDLIAGEPERAARVLVDALGMWRGSPLADFTYESFARNEIVRLDELRLSVLEDRIDADLASGRHVDLVGELEALVAEYSLRERLWGHLMTALYRTGRQAEALRAYQQARDALAEIGIEPSEELKAIEEQVLQHDPLLQVVRRPVRRHNLPERISSFIGREEEIQDLARLIGTHRLVTVTGAGGIGKSSLVVEAVRRLVDYLEDGIWMVPVGSLGDPGLISERLANALGLQPGQEVVSAVCDHLATREAIIVLDGCERYISDVATLVERLLAEAPDVIVVATSREPLQVGGEALFSLGVLDSTSPDGAAVHLFVERARLVNSTFKLTSANVAATIRVCERLAGIPLAIELAAARLGTLTLDQIAVRLDDQMALLVRGTGDRTQHDSLRATVDWSYDLLTPIERRLFARLSVFRGGFSIEATEAVCGDEVFPSSSVADVVSRLSEASLVRRAEGRFEILDPIQQYAETKLSDRDLRLLGERHAAYYLQLARHTSDLVFGPDEMRALHRFEIEEPNFAAAIAWALDNQIPIAALGLAAALTIYWRGTARSAALERFAGPLVAQARANPSADSVVLLCHVAFTEVSHGERDVAEECAIDALEMARSIEDPFAVGHAQFRLATVVDDTDFGIECTRQSIEVLDAIDHPWSIDGLFNLATMLASRPDDTGELLREAHAVASELLERATEVGARSRQAAAHQALGDVAKYSDHLYEAMGKFELAVGIDAELGNRRWVVANLMSIAQLEYLLGNYQRSRALVDEVGEEYEEAWGAIGRLEIQGLLQIVEGDLDGGTATLFEALGGQGVDGVVSRTYGGVADAELISDLADVAYQRGEMEVSVKLHSAASALRQQLKYHVIPRETTHLEGRWAQLRDCLGDEEFERAWSIGEAMAMDEAIGFAAEALESKRP